MISKPRDDEMLWFDRRLGENPSVGRGNVECLMPGSLASLMRRYADMSNRYKPTANGKGQTFRRRAKPKWHMVSYENDSTTVCFDLLDRETSTLVAWPTVKTMALVTTVRDAAVSNLKRTLPDREAEINRTLIGRKANGENTGPASARVRIIPLPSIGHEMISQEVRRILIEIPGDCPLRADDVIWAFSGQTFSLHGRNVDLVRSQAHRQLEHYGITANARRHWQTVTPVALSAAVRRRIEPDPRKRQPSDLKGAGEKRFEQELAASAIRQALRHAGVRAAAREIRVQREPFTSRGQKAENFDVSPRFSNHALWHVSLELDQTVIGPMVLGDGRFLGLGLMRPVTSTVRALAFQVTSGLTEHSKPLELAGAFRRAVMARVRDETGSTRLDTYFTGHNRDGSPAQRETQPHLSYIFDPTTDRLLIIPPSNLDSRNSATLADKHRVLEAAVEVLHTLRAGTSGKICLHAVVIDEATDHLFTGSKCWTTLTPYAVNRHAKKTTAESVIRRDILAECERRGLPRPEIDVLDWHAQRSGLHGRLRLTFKDAIQGPIILGRTRYIGGGVFSATGSCAK